MSTGVELPVAWLRLALQDLNDIAVFIATDDAVAAQAVVEALWLAGQSLRLHPERGRPGRVPGTRELVLTDLPYFIAYRVKADQVQILRVLHTARKWPLQ